MARQINWDEPLSEEDRAWAAQRLDLVTEDGRTLAQRIEENDQKHGVQAKKASQTRAERIRDIDSEMASLRNERERLVLEQAEEDRVNAQFGGTEADRRLGLGFKDNTPVNGERPQGSPEPKETYEDHTYWTKARLTEELENRNRERESQGLDRLPVTGNRSELVERLMKDDEEIED